jgi:hypothetical protein
LEAPLMGSAAGWLSVAVIGAATVAIKAAGPVLLGGRPVPGRLMGVVVLLAPALLAALVATLTLGGDQAIELDARVLGVGVAAVALLLRAPTLLVVILAAAVTGLARWAGIG